MTSSPGAAPRATPRGEEHGWREAPLCLCTIDNPRGYVPGENICPRHDEIGTERHFPDTDGVIRVVFLDEKRRRGTRFIRDQAATPPAAPRER